MRQEPITMEDVDVTLLRVFGVSLKDRAREVCPYGDAHGDKCDWCDGFVAGVIDAFPQWHVAERR